MKKTLLALVLAFVVILSNTGVFAETNQASIISAKTFNDISGHWAQEAINKVADPGIFADEKGNFSPGKAITRSEFATMLHKALGIQIMYFKATNINEFFSDVKNEDTYASALYDLVIANIIDYKGKFRPDDTLSRQELVHYIINSLEYMTGGDYAMIMMMPEPFADAAAINPDFNNDFVKAQIMKLVYGRTDKKFYPTASTTRAEAAVVISRLVNLLDSFKVAEEVKVIPSANVFEGSINMQLVIANNTKNAITINHTSGQKYDFAILDSNKNELYRWSANKRFAAMLSDTIIAPGESVTFSDKLEKDQYNTIAEKAVSVKAFIIGDSKDFTINTDGYEVSINKQ